MHLGAQVQEAARTRGDDGLRTDRARLFYFPVQQLGRRHIPLDLRPGPTLAESRGECADDAESRRRSR